MKSPDSGGGGLAWRVVALLWVAFFLNYMDRQIVFSIFPVLKRELAFTDTQLGLLGSLFTWTYSICMPLTGRLSDRLPRPRMVVGSVVLWSGAMIGTALSSSVGWFLFWRVAMGMVESLYIPAAYGLIASLHGEGTRARAFAVHQTAQLAGIVAGGWFGGWAGEAIGWRTGYQLLGAIGIGYALLLAAGLSPIPATLQPPDRQRVRAPAPWQSPEYRRLLLATFFFSMVLWQIYAWLPNHAYERHHLSLSQSGLVATLFIQVSSAIGVLTGGFLADRLSRKQPRINSMLVAAGDLLTGPLAWATLAASSLGGMKVAAIAFGFSSGLHVGSIFPAASRVVDPSHYGLAAGLLNLCGGLAGGAGMLLAGRAKDTLGLAWVAGAAGIGCAAGGLMLVAYIVQMRDGGDKANTASGSV